MRDAPGPTRARRQVRPSTVPARTRLDFWLDAVILVGFTVAYSFTFTGLTLHEWWSLLLALILIAHLSLHWDWVVRTTRRMVTRRGRDRLVWLVNLLLLITMTLCVTFGVLISMAALPSVGLHPAGNDFWTGMHDTCASITLLLVPVHAALRWRWIVSVGRRLAGAGRAAR